MNDLLSKILYVLNVKKKYNEITTACLKSYKLNYFRNLKFSPISNNYSVIKRCII